MSKEKESKTVNANYTTGVPRSPRSLRSMEGPRSPLVRRKPPVPLPVTKKVSIEIKNDATIDRKQDGHKDIVNKYFDYDVVARKAVENQDIVHKYFDYKDDD